ncbi:MAG TPA: Rpn family recombination-promoting nuclease/putative transposase [Arsenophonus sp.]
MISSIKSIPKQGQGYIYLLIEHQSTSDKLMA